MLKIRPAVIEDVPAMLHVHREAVFAKAGSHYDEARMQEWSPGPTPDRLARVEQEVSDPNMVVLIAEADGELIGFSMVKLQESELRAIYVKPNSIGNVGRALLAETEKRALGAGLKSLTCDASLNAENFYKANNYASEGIVEHAVRGGGTVPCMRMKKYLLG